MTTDARPQATAVPTTTASRQRHYNHHLRATTTDCVTTTEKDATTQSTRFDTAPGTRGTRQPRGRLRRWINTRAINRIRTGGTFKGIDALVLTTIGAKTGATRRTPVLWFPNGHNSWLIVAAARGAPNHPAWYHNIAAHPHHVRIHVAGRTIPVSAEQLHQQDHDAAWQHIVTAAPHFAKYERQTDRELPVIRLTVRSSNPALALPRRRDWL